MEKFRGKIFNDEVFEMYLRKIPDTKERGLINAGIFTNVNKYKEKMTSQTGGYAITEPIMGRIGGTPVNYDGETDIPSGAERDTFFQRKISYGRAMSWGEYDFTSELTGKNFMAEAGEVKEFWDNNRQETVLSILKGIFSMEDTVGKKFADKHTYDITANADPNFGVDTVNRAAQKALGDKKAKISTIVTSSAVSTNLEGLRIVEFLKYTDKDGIQRDLTIGTVNGRTLIVDDDMPTEEVAASGNGDTAVAGYTKYTSYAFAKGFFEYEDLGVEKPVELDRNAKEKGGHTDLISRIREIIVPYMISYKGTDKKSPMNTDFENGANWELVNNGDNGTKKVYVDDKIIPLVRIISRG